VINVFDRQPKPDLEVEARIKRWASELFGLAEDATVLVTELRCREAGCRYVETVIAVLGEPGKARRHKLLKWMAEVTREDVAGLAARGTHG
jgi:hypothetical protein